MASRNNRRVANTKLARTKNMINDPTIVPTTNANGEGLVALGTDPYVAIEVDTTNETVAQTIVLFDASMGYQLSNKLAMSANTIVRGITAPYQFILNDVAHNASFFDVIKQNVSDANVAMTQYAHPLRVFESSKGSSPKNINTIYPDMGVHEGQYQTQINTFTSPLIITNRTAIVYVQEPGIKLVWGFYQKAELGRKQ